MRRMFQLFIVWLLVSVMVSAACYGQGVVFLPSNGRRFGGELVRNTKPEIEIGLSALEKAAKSEDRMLSREEILATLAETGVALSRRHVQAISYAVHVVQRSEISLSELKGLYEVSLGSVETLSGETTITSKLNGIKYGSLSYDMPARSVYQWCVGDGGTSRLAHSGETPWPGLPLKCVIGKQSTTLASSKEEEGVQSVYRLLGQELPNTFPEWHPLVSARYSPSISGSGIGLFSVTYSNILRSGSDFFDGYIFARRSVFQGVDCYVFGDLEHAVYIDADNLGRIVGECSGHSWLREDGAVGRIVQQSEAVVRINHESELVGELYVPTNTSVRIVDEGGHEGAVNIRTEILPGKCGVEDDFSGFEPYVFLDEVEGISTSVGSSRRVVDRSADEETSWLIWGNVCVLLLIAVALWLKHRNGHPNE